MKYFVPIAMNCMIQMRKKKSELFINTEDQRETVRKSSILSANIVDDTRIHVNKGTNK